MSTALYRRYRPQTFADVIGQEHVTEPLQQALRAGRIGHAYLFSGPRGCGKTTSARILARCLNCEQGPTPTPCGTCDSCVALARGGPGSVDVIEIDAASHGGVEDARDLREKASYGPAQSRFKVYIIDEAHMVTPQGFNALLKIVEEPPEHVKFVFATTEPEKVIGTIRSRTHHYPFRLVPPARLQSYLEELCELEGVRVEPGVLSFVIRAGGGSVRDSLSVLDQLMAGAGEDGLTYAGAAALLGFTEAELLDATVDAIAATDGAAVFRQIDRVIETGQDPRRFVEDLLERFRDLVVVAAVNAGGGEGLSALFRGLPSDQLERMSQQAAAFGPGELSHAADIVNAGLTEMTGATSPRLQLELICARVLLPTSAGEHGYAARIDRIEKRLEMAGPQPPAVPRGRAAAPTSSAEVAGDHAEAASPVSAPSAAPAVEAAGPLGDDPGPAAGNAAPSAPPSAASTPGGGVGGIDDPARGAEVSSPGAAARAEAGSRTPDSTARAGGLGDPATPDAPGHGAGRRPDADDTPEAAAPARPSRGGLDTDALRRAWPDVLAKVFSIRRVTWTFLSEHAQVLDYDGERLLVGIATAGLAQTFRNGHHGEVVRQALIEARGIDTRVEGVPMDEAGRHVGRSGGSAPRGGPASPGDAGGGAGRRGPADRRPPETARESRGGGSPGRPEREAAADADPDPASDRSAGPAAGRPGAEVRASGEGRGAPAGGGRPSATDWAARFASRTGAPNASAGAPDPDAPEWQGLRASADSSRTADARGWSDAAGPPSWASNEPPAGTDVASGAGRPGGAPSADVEGAGSPDAARRGAESGASGPAVPGSIGANVSDDPREPRVAGTPSPAGEGPDGWAEEPPDDDMPPPPDEFSDGAGGWSDDPATPRADDETVAVAAGTAPTSQEPTAPASGSLEDEAVSAADRAPDGDGARGEPGRPAESSTPPASASDASVPEAPAVPARGAPATGGHDAGAPGRARGREAFREARRAAAARAAGGTGPVVDVDEGAHVDDEDITDLDAVGQPVIADVLGGTVIAELDD